MLPEEFLGHIRALHPEARLVTLAAAVSLAHSPREAAPFAHELFDLARTPHGTPIRRRTLQTLLRGFISHIPPSQVPASDTLRAQALATVLGHWPLLPDDLRRDLTANLSEVATLLPDAIESLLRNAQPAYIESLAVAIKEFDYSPALDADDDHPTRTHLRASILRLLSLTHAPHVCKTASETAFSIIHRGLATQQTGPIQFTPTQTEFLYQVLEKAHATLLKPLLELALIAFSSSALSSLHQTNHAARLADLAQNNEPLRRALCSVISWSKVPCVPQWAIRFLLYSAFAPAATRRIQALNDQPLASRIQALSKDHLLLRPARQLALQITKGNSKANTGSTPAPSPAAPFTLDEVRALPAHLRPLLGHFFTHLNVLAPTKAPLLRALLVDPSLEARYAAMVASPSESLPDWCFDPHPAIARSATLRYLDLSKTHHATLLADLMRSPHEAVVVLARTALQAQTHAAPSPSIKTTDRACVPPRARSLPSPFELLNTANNNPAAAQSMLTWIQQGGLVSDFVEPLLTIARAHPFMKVGEQDRAASRLQATALSLLGEVKALASFDRSECLAEWIMRDTLPADPRATANAIDAIDRMNRRGEPIPAPLNARIHELASNPEHPLAQNHRIRASAIRASCSLIAPHPLPQLSITLHNSIAMLMDPRPGHAIAGAWLAGLLARVNARKHAQLGQLDHEPALRIQSLLTQLSEVEGPSQLRLRASVSLLQWKHLTPPAMPLKLNTVDGDPLFTATPTANAA